MHSHDHIFNKHIQAQMDLHKMFYCLLKNSLLDPSE